MRAFSRFRAMQPHALKTVIISRASLGNPQTNPSHFIGGYGSLTDARHFPTHVYWLSVWVRSGFASYLWQTASSIIPSGSRQKEA